VTRSEEAAWRRRGGHHAHTMAGHARSGEFSHSAKKAVVITGAVVGTLIVIGGVVGLAGAATEGSSH